MLRLERAIKQGSHHAPVIPHMFPALVERQVAIRRGEVTMIAGRPGAGKSTLALAIAARSKVPTLYVSADTHAHTMSLRLLSMLSGADQAEVEPAMDTHPEWVQATLKQASHIRWCFDSAPSIQSIELELDAMSELHGDTPELLVIDNLTDVVGGEGDEWAGMRGLLKDMKWLSREHSCATLVLHHTSESFPTGGRDGSPTPPMRALQGKVAQTPALVLTVSNHDPGVMYVTPVKNRYGASWPTGDQPTWLGYNPASMQVFDPSERDK